MKSGKLILCGLTILLLSACSKQKISDGTQKKEVASSLEKVQEISRLNQAEQLLAFELFSPSEKYLFWKARLENALADTAYNSNQKALISDVLNKFGPDFYESGINNDREIFQNVFVPRWIQDAKSIFTNDQIYYLFYSMSTYDQDVQNASNPTPNLPAANKCKCNIGSQFTCQRIKITWSYPPSATTEYGDCSLQVYCESSQFGCGFFGLWSCNGSTCTYSGSTPPNI